jgi:UDP-glucose 4-epimerase
MTWLVTGGAGYIGSHVVRAFREAGTDVVVLDSLSSGHREFVPADVPFVHGNVMDRAAVRTALTGQPGEGRPVSGPVEGVVHLAAFKYAGVSVQQPIHTYLENVTGTTVLLDEMRVAGVGKIVYSSSAAVYGTPDVDTVTEETPAAPESPYGESKLVGEWLLRDQARATALRHTALRYFNVVGSATPELYDTSPHNLFPVVLDVLATGGTPQINGADYPTPDGTCVRDYLHVADLAVSHVAAARALADGRELQPVYNLGSGDGVSVREIMQAMRRVTGIAFEPRIGPRRPGDPARIVASGALAGRDLDWKMRHTLDQMVASAWQARQRVESASR